MRIGIDIDGVLTDIEQWQLDFGSKYMSEEKHMNIVNNEGYDLTEIYNVSKEYDTNYWNKYIMDYVENEPARKFCGEVIKKLKDEGNEIYIITARYLTAEATKEGENMRNIVKKWLKKYNIYYDNIIFSPEDKLEVCMENRIDLMIDDRVENVNQISTKIPVICFHAGYNKLCMGNNIYRCYSWYDIYETIRKISEKIITD